MGRLENIIARNRNPKGNRERLTVGIGLGLFLLLIIFLVVFTELGIPDEPAPAPSSIDPTDRRVDDVKLYVPPPRPAPPR